MMENTGKLLGEIADLKAYKYQVEKALARIENWQKEAGPNSGYTLEKVLDIFREETR